MTGRMLVGRLHAKLAHLAGKHVWSPLARRLAPHLAVTPLYHPSPGRVVIGERVHLANTVLNTRSGTITLEDNVFFGHGCMLLAGTHDSRLHGVDRHGAVPASGKDITIRNGAFIASGVIVLGPAEIGADAVVAAGSVVRGDLPGGWICAGNPAVPVSEIRFKTADPAISRPLRDIGSP